MLSVEAVRLQDRFEQMNIPLPILKGLPLAQRAYRTISLKHGRDIDLLVPPEHAGPALRLLEAEGYALVDPAREMTAPQREAFIARGYEMELRHAERGTRVELHWRLSENRYLTSGIAAFGKGQTVPLPGGMVRTLNDADLFVYLCVHGSNHFWFRLKWLADLDALIGAIDGLQIPMLYRHAQAHGAGLCGAQALLLCERILGRALPDALRGELTSSRRVRRLVDIALRNMADPAAGDWPRRWSRQATEMGWRFLAGRGSGFVAAQCAIALTAPADVIRWPLPRRFQFIYPLICIPSRALRRATGLGRGGASEFTRSATGD
jgi:hypothetical protein